MADSGAHENAKKTPDGPQQSQGVELSPGIDSPAPGTSHAARRARVDPRSLTPANVLYLQRTIGNHATQQLLARQMPAPSDAPSISSTAQRPPPAQSVQRTSEPKPYTALAPVANHLDPSSVRTAQRQGAKVISRRDPVDPSRTISPKPQRAPAIIQRVIGDTATTTDWTKAKKVSPSTDGAKGGVMFVRMESGILHIIKGVRSAASVLFAEQLVGEISGAETTESIPIRNTGEGESKAIMDMLTLFAGRETDLEMKNVWNRNLPMFQSAPFLMIQKAMTGESMDKTREENPMAILDNPKLLEQMGRTLAADTLIGNADRFEGMNTGNAFLTQNKNVGAIDTEAILQSHEGFREFLKTGVGMTFGGSGDPIKDWVTFITGEGVELTKQGMGAPSSDLVKMTRKFDHWFETSFKYSFVKNDKHGRIPKKFNWDKARLTVLTGFEAGLRQIAQKFSGENYKKVSARFRELETESGVPDENFSLEALKVKATYLKSFVSSDPNEDPLGSAMDIAGGRGGVVDKAVAVVANHDESVTEVFARPLEMTGKEKSSRTFTRPKNLEKEGKALKKLVRTGGSDPKLESQIREGAKLGTLDRSGQKALYELSLKRFVQALQTKTQKVAFLDDIAVRGRGVSHNPSLDTELAMKRRMRLMELLENGARGDIFTMGNAITEAKMNWLNTAKVQPQEENLGTSDKKKLQTKLDGWQQTLTNSYEAFAKQFTSFREHTR